MARYVLISGTVDTAPVFSAYVTRDEGMRIMHSRIKRSSASVSSIFVGAWKWEPDKRLIYADAGISEFFGVPIQSGLAGISTLDFLQRIHLRDRAQLNPILVHAANNRLPFSVTYRVVTPEEGLRQVRSIGRLLNVGSQSPEYIGAIIDMGAGSDFNSPLVNAIDLLISAREQMACTDHAILTKLIDAVLMEANRALGVRNDDDR